MSDDTSSAPLKGSCYCGSVRYEVRGNPVLSAYCHCTGCQRLTGCPFIHTVHFPLEAFSWTIADPDLHLDKYSPVEKPWKTRVRCKNCGASVASHNSKANKWSIWAAHLSRDGNGRIIGIERVRATAHIFYDTRIVDVDDKLGKWDGYENTSRSIG